MYCTCCLLTPGKNRQLKLARLRGSHGQRQGVTPQPGARPLPARQQSRMPICSSAAPFPIRDVWSGDWRELEVTPSTNRVATQLLLLTQPSKQTFHAGKSGFLMTLVSSAWPSITLESQHYKHHATFTWFTTINQNPHTSKTPEQQLNASRISKDVLRREILFSEDKGNRLKATHKMNTPFQRCTVVQKVCFSFLAQLQWCFTHLKLIPREAISKQTQTSFRSWTTAQLKAHLQLIPETLIKREVTWF